MNDFLDLLPFKFKGLDFGTGKRNVDLVEENKKIPQTVSELAKFKEIPMDAALALPQINYGTGLIPVVPVAQKADTFLEKIKSLGRGGAKYSEQVYDPKSGRLVGKDRPTGALGALASIMDAKTFGLTDFDQKGGGLLGSAKSLRGFGGQPTDFKLSKQIKDQLKTEVDKASTNPVDSIADVTKAITDFAKASDTVSRKGRVLDSALEFLNYAAVSPKVIKDLKDVSTFKQQQLLEAEAIKQGLPNAVQNRLGSAALAAAQKDLAVAAQLDAATRMAGVGMRPPTATFTAG